MRSSAAYVSILLLGWTCLPGQTSQAQTLFTDVTLSTLGNVTHTGSANTDIRTGTATFIDVTATAFPGITTPQRGTSASWGDYDKDGYLDLYVTNHKPIDGTGAGSQDRLFHNNGNGTFTDVSYLLGLENLG